MSQELSTMLELVEDVKGNLTDQQYRGLMDAMMETHRTHSPSNTISEEQFDRIHRATATAIIHLIGSAAGLDVPTGSSAPPAPPAPGSVLPAPPAAAELDDDEQDQDSANENMFFCAHCGEPIVRDSREHDHALLDPTGEHIFCVNCHEYCPTEDEEEDGRKSTKG